MSLAEIKKEVALYTNEEKGKFFQKFFKTGKGQYAEGDLFLGISVPTIRSIAKKYVDKSSIKEAESLLNSKFHEERLLSLIILVYKFEKAEKKEKEEIFNFYIKNTSKINNWDLVDVSAANIVGRHILDKDVSIIYSLAKSKNLWEKRIAIVSTYAFIKSGELEHTFKISETLMNDKHDLIHKAVGWMLREAGKKNQKALENFLKKHYKSMPRTALRYAIERFPQERRKQYLKGKI